MFMRRERRQRGDGRRVQYTWGEGIRDVDILGKSIGGRGEELRCLCGKTGLLLDGPPSSCKLFDKLDN